MGRLRSSYPDVASGLVPDVPVVARDLSFRFGGLAVDGRTRGNHGYKTFGRNRSLRLPAFDYASPHAYFVTVGTYQKLPLLSEPRRAEVVFDCLIWCRDRYGYAVYAYCLMPDHVHLLATPVDGAIGLPGFIGAFKSLSTRSIWKQGHQGVLWQKHYYDHIVRGEESISSIADYILDNPVRRGIVSSRDAYHFSGVLDEIQE